MLLQYPIGGTKMKNKQKWMILLLVLMLAVSAIGALVQPALGENWQGEENQILFDGENSTIQGTGADGVGAVTTITQGGSYVLAGNYAGQIVVDVSDNSQVTLVLNGLNVTAPNGPALWEKQSGGLTIVLAAGTHNSLTDTVNYTVDDQGDPNGALYVKNSLTLTGEGSLEVNGQYEHGVVVKDDLVIEGGSLSITALKDGLRGRDSTLIKGGNITITAGEDGIKANNDGGDDKGYITIEQGNITITAGEDGIQAESSLTIGGSTLAINSKSKGFKAINMYLNGGDVAITSQDDAINAKGSITIVKGNYALTCVDDGIHADEDLLVQGGTIAITSQNEGMEAARITIAGGSTAIYALDDGMNADGGDKTAVYKANGKEDGEAVQENVYINIEGGEVYISTSDGDGLDSNGNVMMSGGSLTIEGMEGGVDVAIDYNGTFELTGGQVVALGGAQMGQYPQSENQSVLVLYEAGEKEIPLTLQNAQGEELLTFTPQKSYQMVVLTHEKLIQGESYTLTIGEETFTFENITPGLNKLGVVPRGGFGGGPDFGGGQPPQGQRPDWLEGEAPPELPEGFEPPEGMEFPEGFEPPDGMTPPDGITAPDGITVPEGTPPING